MGHIENDSSNNSCIVACVFVTAVTFLPSRCLATIGGFLLSRCLGTMRFLSSRCQATIREFLPSRCLTTIRGTFTEPLPSNDREGYTHAHRQQRDLISLLLFFQNKESRLAMLHSSDEIISAGWQRWFTSTPIGVVSA
jgi:hypothetical protein